LEASTKNTDPQDAGSVVVWVIDLTQPPDIVCHLRDVLSPEERSRADKFVRREIQSQYTIAHAAMRYILAAALGASPRTLQFTERAHGKPQLIGDMLRFNLSHAGELALLAVGYGRELGVDVEPIRSLPEALDLAGRYFSPTETAKLLEVNPSDLPRSFFECWTRKEAFIKAIGQGLSYPLHSFDVTFYPDMELKLTIEPEHRGRWSLHELRLEPNYCGALVVEHTQAAPGLPAIQLRRFQPSNFLQSGY
jgi:4'-phosphopantetheinyl transferase